ncbi:MAG: sigma 54-interacting transcriptional regulator [Geobacteraceae bacterium]|nr:sigma 54-interacting transcriptional regulator [Geobacteraceae bacterium]
MYSTEYSERGTFNGEPPLGIIRLDAELRIVSFDEIAGGLIGISPEKLMGQLIEHVADLGNLGNLMHSSISFSSQIAVVRDKRILCDYVPILEEGRVTGGALSLLEMLREETARGPSDELKVFLRSAGALMDLDHNGVIIIDREGTVVMVNQSFAEVLDTTPQAMIGKHIHQFYANCSPSRMPFVMDTGKPEISSHYMNGKEVFASRFPLIKAGKVIGCMGKILFKDIREITLIANRLQAAPEFRNRVCNVAGGESLFKYDINSIIGQNRHILELKKTLLRVAGKNSNVLLRGESGTGKELFAHALHAASPRRYAPFVKLNCAAIPENLLESELFGYAEGAFTGAKKGGHTGKFEQAHTGTIFLDEIGDMPLYMQVKMLRVLQERELTQIGSTKPKMVDVRVVAATNSNLERLVKDGKFREDLYYRLNVVVLTIPALRERMDDIDSITKNFIDQFNSEFGLQVQGLDPGAMDVIRHYNWPGNIRELRNVIESAFNLVTGPFIRCEHLPAELSKSFSNTRIQSEYVSEKWMEDYIHACLGKKSVNEIMDAFEKVLVNQAIERCSGNKLLAAQLLGISRPGLYKKLQKFIGNDGGADGPSL